jgi:transposase
MFQRKDLGDLSAQHRLQFLGAVDKAKLQGRTMKEVAAEWGLNKNCYARWTKQLVEEGSLESKKSRAGRPPKLQAEHYEKLRKLNREKLGDWTYRELAHGLKKRIGFVVSHVAIWRMAKKKDWRDVPKYTRPWLTDEQKEARRKWAAEKLEQAMRGRGEGPWYCHVDIDEKIFRCFTRKRKTKKDPEWLAEDQRGSTRVKSKSHIPQTMFLSAVAQPEPKHKFDGRIGIFRCAEKAFTQRKSKYRDKGVEYMKDVPVTADFFKTMLKEKVIPAICEKMSWAKEVVIQMDNARAHIGGDLVAEMTAFGATTKPKVRIEMQPANSPDTNINDLCFFSSLASAVSKTQTPDPEALAKAVEDKYWTWHSTAKLAKLWQLKTAVCGCIWSNDGDNDYKLPHGVGGGAAGRAPRNKPR